MTYFVSGLPISAPDGSRAECTAGRQMCEWRPFLHWSRTVHKWVSGHCLSCLNAWKGSRGQWRFENRPHLYWPFWNSKEFTKPHFLIILLIEFGPEVFSVVLLYNSFDTIKRNCIVRGLKEFSLLLLQAIGIFISINTTVRWKSLHGNVYMVLK
ncbi:hypothetical protein TNIN_233341 [Trichonephila inaurata madagascariensis]|uniref:Uncharacterized protein n=1 Tax=Trichonephila inaurata madagascariensis TaxID=2747483 RepID=A0A8X7CE87_9ARAC|nr:hypothetical protein TNIN_233341 [Trichonephila inaurata madagascariensis]